MGKNNKEICMVCKYLENLIFFIPLLYAIKIHFIRRTRLGFFMWMGEYMIPTLLSLYIISVKPFSVIEAFIIIICVYNFYEIGYIQNDGETIKKEANPTMRLSDDELRFYEINKIWIYLERVFICIVFGIYLVMNTSNVILTLTILCCIIPLYIIYNSVRGRINQYLIFCLMLYRYCVPILLFSNFSVDYRLIILIIASYPLPTLVQICAKEKYGKREKWASCIIRDYAKRDIFRIEYYIMLLCFSAFLVLKNILPLVYMSLPIYYFLFRFVSYFTRIYSKKAINKSLD